MAKNGLGSILGIVAAVLAVLALMVSVWHVGPVGPPGPRGRDGKVIAPIGAIIAWHANTLAISHPDDEHKRGLSLKLSGDGSWITCDGQTIARADYPLLFTGYPDDVAVLELPNLNKAEGGTGRFLRGGAKSGALQEHAMEEHSHGGRTTGHEIPEEPAQQLKDHVNTYGMNAGWVAYTWQGLGSHRNVSIDPAGRGEETRPENMSVVWIMRVK